MKNTTLPTVPRLESLHHRLKNAKGPEGETLALLDELMVFLEDPPPEVGDRWQAGAEFCAAQGIVTSRAAVWRLYRAHVVEWRYENAPDFGKVSEKESAQLQEQTRHLLDLRAFESLRHPNLPPRVLVGLVQNENRREELQLARDKFNDQLKVRQHEETMRIRKRIEQNAQHEAMIPYVKKYALQTMQAYIAEQERHESKSAAPATPS